MNVKIIIVLCLVVYTAKAQPHDNDLNKVLKILGLSYSDSFDYNSFILNLETVVEAAQKAVIDTIEETVAIAQEFTRVVRSLGTHQNVKEINAIQTGYFQRIEDMRHEAFNQQIDISTCAFNAVHQLNSETIKSINNITYILNDITNIFNNYSQLTYIDPANKNLETTYSIRERIYKCPFSFTDYKPFYVCLTANAVLADIQVLSQFTDSLNKTMKDVSNLVKDYSEAANLFRAQNVDSYSVTVGQIFDDQFVSCTQEQGVII